MSIVTTNTIEEIETIVRKEAILRLFKNDTPLKDYLNLGKLKMPSIISLISNLNIHIIQTTISNLFK